MTPQDPAEAGNPIGSVRSVTATAPVRVADVGGWTDTWFAGHGAVCPLGVGPGIRVDATLGDADPPARPVRIIAADLGEDYHCGPSRASGWSDPRPGRHPLLEHAVGSVCEQHPPTGPVRVAVRAAVPPGASLGTSASVVVAVIAALEALLGDRTDSVTVLSDHDRRRLAEAAHRVETERAGRESGIQDQWAAAFGGAQLITMAEYPEAERRAIHVDPATTDHLAGSMVTIGLGRHDSSAVHRQVITALTAPGEIGARRRAVLDELTVLAHEAADTLGRGDVDGWARTLTRATEAQERLHPDLVGHAHRQVIETARSHGATGWKVNGAGGSGGSVTTVFATPDEAARFRGVVPTAHPRRPVFDLRLSAGVSVRDETRSTLS